MKSSGFKAGILCVFLLMAHTCYAGQIARDDLKLAIGNAINAHMLMALPPMPSSKKLDSIKSRSMGLASSIDSLPDAEIDSKLADWITESTLNEVDLNAKQLTGDDDNEAVEITNYLSTTFKTRLQSLTEQRGSELISERDSYLSSEAVYRPKFDNFVFSSIKKERLVVVPLSGLPGVAIYVDSFHQIVANMAAVSRTGPLNNKRNELGNVDVTGDELENELLTRVLIYDIRSMLEGGDIVGSFVGNLYAPVYDIDAKTLVKPLTFEAAMPGIQKLMEERFLHKSEGTCRVNLAGMISFVLGCDYIRYGEQPPPPHKQSETSELPTDSITFRMDSAAWANAKVRFKINN